ncbi:MAG: hypothetical protein EOL87_18605 [Spartobacteria bacterium]|nr:hypothetical protein [Spartobacteria bacterium]
MGYWEGRFKCQRLLDESAILTCMAYVDLNPVRAKMAESLEDSVYTSVYERLAAEKAKMREFLSTDDTDLHRYAHDEEFVTSKRADWLVPVDETLFFEYKLTVDEYLALVDLTGRRLAAGKKGQIQNEDRQCAATKLRSNFKLAISWR